MLSRDPLVCQVRPFSLSGEIKPEIIGIGGQI